MKRKADAVFALFLLFNDLASVAVAFYLAYRLRQAIAVPPPINIAPFADYVGMMIIQVVTLPL